VGSALHNFPPHPGSPTRYWKSLSSYTFCVRNYQKRYKVRNLDLLFPTGDELIDLVGAKWLMIVWAIAFLGIWPLRFGHYMCVPLPHPLRITYFYPQPCIHILQEKGALIWWPRCRHCCRVSAERLLSWLPPVYPFAADYAFHRRIHIHRFPVLRVPCCIYLLHSILRSISLHRIPQTEIGSWALWYSYPLPLPNSNCLTFLSLRRLIIRCDGKHCTFLEGNLQL